MREQGGIIRKLQKLVRWLNRCPPFSVFNWGLALLSVPTLFGFLLLSTLGLEPRVHPSHYSLTAEFIREAVWSLMRLFALAGVGLWLSVAGRVVLHVTKRLGKAGRSGPSAPDGPPDSG